MGHLIRRYKIKLHAKKFDLRTARISRDFFSRPQKDQAIFTRITWCDSCFFDNLGMVDPVEFELKGKYFVEGKCNRCGGHVISEIIPKHFIGTEEDCIRPIHHPSRPALTRISPTLPIPMPWDPLPENVHYLSHAEIKPNKNSKIILWILALICGVLVLNLLLKGLIS
jgi:hypothetical protein